MVIVDIGHPSRHVVISILNILIYQITIERLIIDSVISMKSFRYRFHEVMNNTHFYGDRWKYDYALKIETSDHFVGSLFILGTIVGFLGNSSAICFFWPRRKKTIHDLLYLAISAVDLVTVSSSFPIIASLLNNRHPIFFENSTFCTTWMSVVLFAARMSIFLAMVICINRTTVMKYPNYPINRALAIAVILGYSVIITVFDVVFLLQPWCNSIYDPRGSYCYIKCTDDNDFSLIRRTLIGIEFLIPSLITAVCFVIGVRILLSRPAIGSDDDNRYRRVSVTISMFTAVFLVFNLPCIAVLIWEALWLTGIPQPYMVIDFDDGWFYFYLMSTIFPMFLNAIANPLLYALRMREYQNWIRQAQRKIARIFHKSGDVDN